jgi:hypothetical protein
LPKKENDENRQIIRLAALLHDIGHGPFSHISEVLLKKYSNNEPKDHKNDIHESISIRLIKQNSELKKILSKSITKDIIDVLKGENKKLSGMSEIISGPLDADKMDYLLRDSYYCGVKYGIFDLERLLLILNTHLDYQLDKTIVVEKEGVETVIQFFLAKYYMTSQVYRYKTRCVADAMIVRALELGIEKEKLPFLNAIYRFKDDDEYLKNFITYWDEKLICKIFDSKPSYTYNIFDLLYKRNLFKIIFKEPIDNFKPEFKDNILSILKNPGTKQLIEKEIAKLIKSITKKNCKAEEVIFEIIKIDPFEKAEKTNEKLLIKEDNDKIPIPFFEKYPIFEKIKTYSVEVYAPLKDNNNRIKEKQRTNIRQIIENCIK